MSDISSIVQLLKEFRDKRDWGQFHNPKDLSIALNIESSELLENYLWKNPDQANIENIREELADVFAYALLLADHYQLDIGEIIKDKIEKNAIKYPVEKSKGNARKYNEL